MGTTTSFATNHLTVIVSFTSWYNEKNSRHTVGRTYSEKNKKTKARNIRRFRAETRNNYLSSKKFGECKILYHNFFVTWIRLSIL